jgi:hypothetical protein
MIPGIADTKDTTTTTTNTVMIVEVTTEDAMKMTGAVLIAVTGIAATKLSVPSSDK